MNKETLDNQMDQSNQPSDWENLFDLAEAEANGEQLSRDKIIALGQLATNVEALDEIQAGQFQIPVMDQKPTYKPNGNFGTFTESTTDFEYTPDELAEKYGDDLARKVQNGDD
ncbi:MAG: hypothetical protein Q4C83_00475 [Candidatus Saccharibacteria bacterium]|nr:hypothetical protein [Candidatus Saccharibacteria bacterium]